MKKCFVALFVFVHMAGSLCAQGVAINTDGAAADGSAILDIKSTDKGILVPRMTAAQRSAIANPAKGLLVFQTDPAPAFCYYNGTSWINLTNGTSMNSDGYSQLYGYVSSLSVDTLDGPLAIVADGKGNLYYTERSKHSIRRMNASGLSDVVAGSRTEAGFVNDASIAARFSLPSSLAIDSSGNIFVADIGNRCIRKISPGGQVSTFLNNLSDLSWVLGPIHLAADASGNLFVSEYNHHTVYKIDASGNITLIAGIPGTAGFVNTADGLGYTFLGNPQGMVVDNAGNLYVTEELNHCIRKITPAGDVSVFAGTGIAGSNDGNLSTATFDKPGGLTIDKKGNMYLTDLVVGKIRRISVAGVVTTLAGTGILRNVDGPGISASFNHPFEITIDASGNLYILQTINPALRRIDLN